MLQHDTVIYKKCCCNFSSESQLTSFRLSALVAHNTKTEKHKFPFKPQNHIFFPYKIHNLNTPRGAEISSQTVQKTFKDVQHDS